MISMSQFFSDSASVCTGLSFVVVACMLAVSTLAVLQSRLTRRRSERLVQEERDRLDAFFESSPTGLVVFDQRRTIVRLNASAARLTAGTTAQVVSQRHGVALNCAHSTQCQFCSAARLTAGTTAQVVSQRHGVALNCAHSTEHAQGCGYSALCQFCALRKVISAVLAEGRAMRDVELPMVVVRDGGLRTVWLRLGAEPFELSGVRHVIVAVDDITVHKQLVDKMQQASSELERMNDEIQKANQAKGLFLANMSHEIRTPLNGIIGMTSLLIDTAMSAEQREYAGTIYSSSEALLQIVNDILDFSKIEANKLVLENAAFDLKQCLEDVVRVMAPSASKKRLELAYNVDKSARMAWTGDTGRIRQVLINLVGNGIKFTERGGVVISVAGKQLDDERHQLEFGVRDTGVGILPEQQERLFQSFTQVDTSATRRFGGAGLGLAISKRLCELMGGTLWVESKGVPGQGSDFRFTIVVRRDGGIQAPSDSGACAALACKRVLLVEGHAATREMLSEHVMGWGMVPVVAGSGTAALAALRSQDAVDVAVIDFELADLGGIQLAKAIHALPSRADLKIVRLVQLGDRTFEGVEKHFVASVTKPATATQLREALIDALTPRSAVSLASPAPRAAPEGARLSDEVARLYPLRILLAEDNVVNQKVAVSLLRKLGYEVDVVVDGVEVLEALSKFAYDVVLMDVQMPELDGEQTTIRIRKETPAERQPWIVAMTANALKGDRERYLSLGMNDYIPKPIRTERLIEVLMAAQPAVRRSGGARGEGDPSPETAE